MATKRKKIPKPTRYRIISYGANEWLIIDLHFNNILAKCALRQDAQEIVWHLDRSQEGEHE